MLYAAPFEIPKWGGKLGQGRLVVPRRMGNQPERLTWCRVAPTRVGRFRALRLTWPAHGGLQLGVGVLPLLFH